MEVKSRKVPVLSWKAAIEMGSFLDRMREECERDGEGRVFFCYFFVRRDWGEGAVVMASGRRGGEKRGGH